MLALHLLSKLLVIKLSDSKRIEVGPVIAFQADFRVIVDGREVSSGQYFWDIYRNNLVGRVSTGGSWNDVGDPQIREAVIPWLYRPSKC